jgi:solute:Na+ symporter, SSS family
MNLLAPGLKGLAFAALTAAIVASLAGKVNSISTIFTLDIYKKFINTNADETKLVSTGRIAILVSMILAIVISPFLGIDKKGGFEFIQEYTGYVSPGIFAMFILGFFWKRTTANAALFATVGGFAMSVFLKFLPGLTDLKGLSTYGFSVLNKETGIYDMPFLDRMGFVFLFCIVGMVLISIADPESKNNPKGLEVDSSMFKMSNGFAVGALIVLGILTALYTRFW